MTPTTNDAYEATSTPATTNRELDLDPGLEDIKIAIPPPPSTLSSPTEYTISTAYRFIPSNEVDDFEAVALLLGLSSPSTGTGTGTVLSTPTSVTHTATSTSTPSTVIAADTSVALEKFTLFPKLVAELRAKIWFHALPGPRVVEIDYMLSAGNIWVCRKESQGSPFSLLLACKESRQEFLRHYTPFLKIATEGVYNEATSRRLAANILTDSVTYLCPAIDSVYICAPNEGEGSVSEESMAALCGIKCLQALETLVCRFEEFERRPSTETQMFNHLPGLKTIIITVGDFGWYELAGDYDNMQRPTGEIELFPIHREELEFSFVDQEHILEMINITAKNTFQDPSKEEVDCYPAYVDRDGAIMEYGDVEWLD
ncbi:hypothetical protein IFR05_013779 [Cadophora sp. M221]|nr:hypothetical protein IFR05_013779 [Cadophora sp. M221]